MIVHSLIVAAYDCVMPLSKRSVGDSLKDVLSHFIMIIIRFFLYTKGIQFAFVMGNIEKKKGTTV